VARQAFLGLYIGKFLEKMMMTYDGTGRIRVLVADDSALMRRQLVRMFDSDPTFLLAGYARDGEDAVTKARDLRPDVIAMDINMPKMDGLTAMQIILAENICPVVVFSSLANRGAAITLEALELGAFDCVAKPDGSVSANIGKVTRELMMKLKAAANAFRRTHRVKPGKRSPDVIERIPSPKVAVPRHVPLHHRAVVIGISTGGPVTIMDVLPLLPAGLPAPVFMVQHMPAQFTGPFAQRLARSCAIPVVEAQHMLKVVPGTCYVAKGGAHLMLHRKATGELVIRTPEKPEHLFIPSVGVMMESVFEHFGPRTVGVLMTGIGDDGAAMMVRIRQAGGRTIAESEESAVVYGMPREAIERGGADVIAPSWQVAQHIVNAVECEDDTWIPLGQPGYNTRK
jgi:two-component system chemotaxis response regulator CheB